MTEPTPIVRTAAGPVRGLVVDGIHRFCGIPYAAAPFGTLRFAAPRPPARWSQVRPAERFGATAPQQEYANRGGLPDVPEPIIPGEDILTVNVWTPDLAPARPLPVLVWIHGGGFTAGCSANPWYDGTTFASDGLVFVSLNYRLGMEGFLELPDAEPNRAVQDWLLALAWVRENVAAFGGDPGEVTVMGQSAGGMAVSVLLTSPRATGLFRRAIIASGVSRASVRTREQAADTAALAARLLGVPARRDAFAAIPPARLVEAQNEIATSGDLLGRVGDDGAGALPWAPVLDRVYVTGPVADAVRGGAGADVPVLVGTTEHEFRWVAMRADPGPAGRRRGQRLTDALFRRPTQEFVDARRTAAPTYRYEFSWQSTADPVIGSGHSIDIPFFFDTLGAPYVHPYTGENPPQRLAHAVHGAFARFARTGDPGWPAYRPDGRTVMVFAAEPHLRDGVHLDG